MNLNYAIQNSGKLAWDGAVAFPIDIRRHVGYAFTFDVAVGLLADTTFTVEGAMPDPADPCIPGAFAPVPEILTCTADFGVQPGPQASLMLPNGTPQGAMCTATLPCRYAAFLRLVAGTGNTANIRVVATLHGPK